MFSIPRVHPPAHRIYYLLLQLLLNNYFDVCLVCLLPIKCSNDRINKLLCPNMDITLLLYVETILPQHKYIFKIVNKVFTTM